MHGNRIQVVAAKLLHQPVGAVLGADEHEGGLIIDLLSSPTRVVTLFSWVTETNR